MAFSNSGHTIWRDLKNSESVLVSSGIIRSEKSRLHPQENFMIRDRFSDGACALEKNNPLFQEGYSLIQLSSSGLVVKPEHGAWREYHRDQLSSSGFVVKSKRSEERRVGDQHRKWQYYT